MPIFEGLADLVDSASRGIDNAFGTGVGGILVRTGLALGAKYALNKFLAPRSRRSSSSTTAQSMVDTRRPAPPVAVSDARWVLGEVRTGGQYVWFQDVDDEQTQWRVFVISEGSCDSIQKIWVDGEEVSFTRTGNRLQATGSFAERLDVYEYFAADGTQGAEIRAACSNFTVQHRYHGLSWVAIRLNQPNWGMDDEERFWTTVPDVEFLVRGLKITWPGQTTPTFTRNVAALRYWVETERRGLSPTVIDRTTFDAALAACATAADFSGRSGLPAGYTTVFQQYTFDDIITADMELEEIQASMDFCWQGEIANAGGVLYFRPGIDRPIRYAITEDHLISIEAARFNQSTQERINAATMTLNQSADHQYLEYEVPEIVDAHSLVQDQNQKQSVDLGAPLGVNLPVKASWLLTVALRRLRDSKQLAIVVFPGFEGNPYAYFGLLPGDWVTLTVAEYGFDEKLFQVYSKTPNDDGTVSLILEEQSRGNYALNLTLPPLMGQPGDLPNSRDVPNVSALASDEIARVQRDGTTVVFLDVTWTALPLFTEVEMRRQGTTAVRKTESRTATASFEGVTVGDTYEVRARHRNRNNFVGDWTPWQANTIDGDLTPPPDPTGVVFTAVPEGWRVNWAMSTATDYKHTAIYTSMDTAAEFADATLLDENDGGSFTQLGFDAVTEVKVWVRHVDQSGNESGAVAVTGSTGKVSSRNLNTGDSLNVDDNGLLGIAGGLLGLLDLIPGLRDELGDLFDIFGPDPVAAPTLTITDLTEVNENQIALLEATVTGGNYDSIEYRWEVVSGGGTIEPVSE